LGLSKGPASVLFKLVSDFVALVVFVALYSLHFCGVYGWRGVLHLIWCKVILFATLLHSAHGLCSSIFLSAMQKS